MNNATNNVRMTQTQDWLERLEKAVSKHKEISENLHLRLTNILRPSTPPSLSPGNIINPEREVLANIPSRIRETTELLEGLSSDCKEMMDRIEA